MKHLDMAHHLRKKLTNRRAALALIEERISEYVEAAPLDIVRKQRAIEREIAELEGELRSQSRMPEMTDPRPSRTPCVGKAVALLRRLDGLRFGRWPVGRLLVFALACAGYLVGWIFLGLFVLALAESKIGGQELVLLILFTAVSGVFVFVGFTADRVLLTARSPVLAFAARLLSPVAVLGLVVLWFFLRD